MNLRKRKHAEPLQWSPLDKAHHFIKEGKDQEGFVVRSVSEEIGNIYLYNFTLIFFVIALPYIIF